jgi:hypothetical protein
MMLFILDTIVEQSTLPQMAGRDEHNAAAFT